MEDCCVASTSHHCRDTVRCRSQRGGVFGQIVVVWSRLDCQGPEVVWTTAVVDDGPHHRDSWCCVAPMWQVAVFGMTMAFGSLLWLFSSVDCWILSCLVVSLAIVDVVWFLVRCGNRCRQRVGVVTVNAAPLSLMLVRCHPTQPILSS